MIILILNIVPYPDGENLAEKINLQKMLKQEELKIILDIKLFTKKKEPKKKNL